MRWRIILLAALAVSLGANGYLVYQLSAERQRVPYYASDQPIIDSSIAAYAAEMRVGRDEAMGPRFPIVARTAEGACVNLRLPEGYLGWTPVYCYSNEGRLTYRGRV